MFAIHTKDVKSSDVVETVRKPRCIGEENLEVVLKEQFVDCSKPITHPIKKKIVSNVSVSLRKRNHSQTKRRYRY